MPKWRKLDDTTKRLTVLAMNGKVIVGKEHPKAPIVAELVPFRSVSTELRVEGNTVAKAIGKLYNRAMFGQKENTK